MHTNILCLWKNLKIGCGTSFEIILGFRLVIEISASDLVDLLQLWMYLEVAKSPPVFLGSQKKHFLKKKHNATPSIRSTSNSASPNGLSVEMESPWPFVGFAPRSSPPRRAATTAAQLATRGPPWSERAPLEKPRGKLFRDLKENQNHLFV